jgi:hypothetical protein
MTMSKKRVLSEMLGGVVEAKIDLTRFDELEKRMPRVLSKISFGISRPKNPDDVQIAIGYKVVRDILELLASVADRGLGNAAFAKELRQLGIKSSGYAPKI